MIPSVNDNATRTAKAELDMFGRQQYVDIHCHCLAGFDDGPATRPEALALCRALVDDCVTTVIATPHQLGRFNDCNEAAQVREAVCLLNEALISEDIDLSVMPGGDVRVDERVCELLKADKILTLADGGRYILLELPHEVFIDIEPLLVELASLSVQAIISHPERHSVLAQQPKILLKWLSHSAHLQVTAGSLLGEFGPAAERAAWQLLSSGLASLIATDSHDLNSRRPRMNLAFNRISTKLGWTIARQLCIENPLRVLKGQNIQMIHSINTRKYSDQRVPTSF